MLSIKSRIIELPICSKVRLTTLGASNDFATAGERLYHELDVPDFKYLLMHAEELTLISLTEGVASTTYFRWGLFAWSGHDRFTELPAHPFQIGATITAAGSLRHSAYSTLTNFLRESRLAIGYGYLAGQAGVVAASVSGTLLVKTIGS